MTFYTPLAKVEAEVISSINSYCGYLQDKGG